jgi:ureidoacrylate peracid hydrolase
MSEPLVGGYGEPRESDFARSAVLVVDMTNDFGHPDGAYSRNGAQCEPLLEVVPAIAALVEAARAAARPVILCSQIVITDADDRVIGSPGLLEARPWIRESGLRSNTWGTRMIDSIPAPDIVVEKVRASGFFATPLDLLLRELGVETVIVVGGYTNQCIEATVRDAWALDYRIVLPADGCAAFDPRLHAATMESLRPLAVQPTVAEIIGVWRN